MKQRILEKDVQRSILAYLEAAERCFWRNNSGAMISEYKGKTRFMRFGAVGSPDIFVVKKSKVYGIEVKGSNGTQSPAQKEFQRNFEAAGGRYVLARSIDDVARVIDSHG